MTQVKIVRSAPARALASALVIGALVGAPTVALADEGGVSFWIPGFFGSLAAAPLQPGFSVANIYYHTTVNAGADVAFARASLAWPADGELQRQPEFESERRRGSRLFHSAVHVRNAVSGWAGLGGS